MPSSTFSRGALWCAPLVASLALLGACDRPASDNRAADDRTAGQRVDEAVARTERKADEVMADARQAGRDARQAAGDAAESVANKSRDAAITTEVKAKLARDERLSALAINVDTAGGRVVLRGSAPDADARSRATQVARGVDGVVSVDNELSVQRN